MIHVVITDRAKYEEIKNAIADEKDKDEWVSIAAFEQLERAYEKKCEELDLLKRKLINFIEEC